LKEHRQFIFKVTFWNFRLTIVAMETQEMCSMDIAKVCLSVKWYLQHCWPLKWVIRICTAFRMLATCWSQTPGVEPVNFARCWWTCSWGQWVQTAYRYVVIDCRETTYCRFYLLTSLLTICFVVYL